MTDLGLVLVSGLAGAVLSAVAALLLAQRQQAKQRRHETRGLEVCCSLDGGT